MNIGVQTHPALTFDGIEAVVFDKDGTLAAVEAYLHQLVQLRVRLLDQIAPGSGPSLFASFGMRPPGVDPAGLLAVGSRRQNEIIAAGHLAAQGIPWIAALDQATVAFRAAAAQLPPKATQTPPMAEAKPLLERLRAAGVKLAIASADTQAEVEAFVATHQLGDYFQVLQGLTPAQPDKGAPQFLPNVCQQLGVSASQTLVVGDAASDGAMAAIAGARGFIGFTGGWSQPVVLPSWGSLESATVNRLSQIAII